MVISSLRRVPIREMTLGSGVINILFGAAGLVLAGPAVRWVYTFLESHPAADAVAAIRLLIKCYIALGLLMVGIAALATALPVLRRRRDGTGRWLTTLDEVVDARAERDEILGITARYGANEVLLATPLHALDGPPGLDRWVTLGRDFTLGNLSDLLNGIQVVDACPVCLATCQGSTVRPGAHPRVTAQSL